MQISKRVCSNSNTPKIRKLVQLFSLATLLFHPHVEAGQPDRVISLSMQMNNNQATWMPQNAEKKETRRYHPTTLLVRFKSATPEFLPDSGIATPVQGVAGLFIVNKPQTLTLHDTIRRYRKKSTVIYAEPDYIVRIANTTPSDPMWNQQWDMVKIAAPAAWGDTTGRQFDVSGKWKFSVTRCKHYNSSFSFR